MKYLSVIVDNNTNATDELYTYGCDIEGVKIGSRVTVGFGMRNSIMDGYVAAISDTVPEELAGKRIKNILELDYNFSLSEEAMDTAMWMHRRYLCRYIEAVKCFLPSFNSRNGRSKDPFADIERVPSLAEALTEDQANALNRICEGLKNRVHDIYLLHGVTGSGKTEVYLQAAAKALADGRSAIVLVPEISLTPQTVSRFINRFGKERIAILHSKLTPAQKDAEYKRISCGEADLVIGARSAIFAPLENIGLIILDEEHETSYKSDKSPKYDAIELAARRASKHSAVVVLGSATPSVSDYYRSERGLFKRIEMPNRYNKTPLPGVQIVDMTKEVKSGNRSPFSRLLTSEMEKCLADKKQVILFLNRRGYSAHVSCRECGYVVECSECGISMPYHKEENACICHYCGRKQRLPQVCPVCGSKKIGLFGTGTEQLEEKLAEIFPQATVDRLDLDSISKKGSLESKLKRFGKGQTDILIGTQLVAKGLDFNNVGLVGVISADISLNIPDFRSAERSFQLLTQAAGRSGRGEEKGKVIIQSFDPGHSAVVNAAKHDYRSFYENEIAIRKAVNYPPYTNIYQLVIADPDQSKAEESAELWAKWLRSRVPEGVSVLGPSSSAVLKLGGQYRFQILIKAALDQRREISGLLAVIKKIFPTDKNGAKTISIDINPYSFM